MSGRVNLSDFNVLAANFGITAGAGDPTPSDWSALSSAVPEPGSVALLAAIATLQLRRRRAAARF